MKRNATKRRRFVPRMLLTATCAATVVPMCALEACGGDVKNTGSGQGGNGGAFFGVFAAGGAFGVAAAGGAFGVGVPFGVALATGGVFGVGAPFIVAAGGFGGNGARDAGPSRDSGTDGSAARVGKDAGAGGQARLEPEKSGRFGDLDPQASTTRSRTGARAARRRA